MPRKAQLMTGLFPYHVTARSNNREWFFLPQNVVWEIVQRQLWEVQCQYHAEVIAFVLMSNHFHWVVHTPAANLDKIMNYFQREVSREIGKQAGRINHVFGGRYKSSLIRDSRYFAHVYKYVYRNPIRAGLCNSVEAYPYSTLPFKLHARSRYSYMDIFHPLSTQVPFPEEARLKWLNEPTPKEQERLIKNALRRVEFQFSKRRNDQSHVFTLMAYQYQKEVGT